MHREVDERCQKGASTYCISPYVPEFVLLEDAQDESILRTLRKHGKYDVFRKIGFGTYSRVYLARLAHWDHVFTHHQHQHHNDRTSKQRARSLSPPRPNRTTPLFAIKVVDDSVISKGEVTSGMLLRHPNISSLIEWFAIGSNYFLIYEFIDGADLQVMWTQCGSGDPLFSERMFGRLFVQLLNALTYCHSLGVVHRDIKLENIVVTNYSRRCPERSVCKLVDFGFAFFLRGPQCVMHPDQILRREDGIYQPISLTEADRICSDNRFVGTIDYCAPELILDAVSEPFELIPTDVYSLGVVLYCALVGKFPRSEGWIQRLNNKRRLWKNQHPKRAGPQILDDPLIVEELQTWGETLKFEGKAPLSAEARDLLRKMLHPLPSRRIGLEGVHKHKWVQNVYNFNA